MSTESGQCEAHDEVTIELQNGRSITFTRSTGEVRVDGQVVNNQDAQVLAPMLRRQPGEIVAMADLAAEVCPSGAHINNNLAARVYRMRARLGDGVIATVHALGYRIPVADPEAFGPTAHMRKGRIRFYPRRRGLRTTGSGLEAELTPCEALVVAFLLALPGTGATDAEVMHAARLSTPHRLKTTLVGLQRKFREIGASQELIVRRGEWSVRDDMARVGPLALEPEERAAYVNGGPVRLEPGWFELLEALAEQPGRTRSLDDLDMVLRRAVLPRELDPLDPADAALNARTASAEAAVHGIQAELGSLGRDLIVSAEAAVYLNVGHFRLWACGTLLLDPGARRAWRGRRSVELSDRQVAVLTEFLRDPETNIATTATLCSVAELKRADLQPVLGGLRTALSKLLGQPDGRDLIIHDRDKDVYRLVREKFGVLQ